MFHFRSNVVLAAGLACCLPIAAAAGPYSTTGIPASDPSFVEWASGCTVTRGYENIASPSLGFASFGTDSAGTGMADNSVVSLGDGGSAVLTFDKPITNGPGNDFAVFENAFASGAGRFSELGFVDVSSDGVNYFRFPSVSLTQTTTQLGNNGVIDPSNIYDLAGKDLALNGTGFDLSELAGVSSLLDVDNVKYVRVTDVVGSIDPAYATHDSLGNIINDPWPTPFASSGFDLDAVGVVNAVAEPSSLFLLGAALSFLFVAGKRLRSLPVCARRATTLATMLSVAAFSSIARADTLSPGFSQQSLNVSPEGQFTADNGNIHYWTHDTGYQIYNTTSGSTTTVGLPPNGTLTNGFGDSFGVYDSVNKAFYAGTNNNAGSYIYEYNSTAGTWSNSTSAGVFFPDVYGAQVHNGQLYVSGGSGTTAGLVAYSQNGIVNNSPPQSLGQVAGFAGYLAVAPNGDLYYAPNSYFYNGSENDTLYQWTASQVASAGVTPLTVGNAAHSFPLPGSGNGLATDSAGDVFFAVNDQVAGTSTLGMLDSHASGGYDPIYTSSDFNDYFGAISVDGNFEGGGTLYFNPGIDFTNSVEAIRGVPEPGSLALLAAAGLIGVVAWRRRRTEN